ncbi:MAG: uridine diphosphate-N-acetylglucosamine-binding protein YvcK [Clostridia bacterium]
MNIFKWFIPGLRVKRWLALSFLGVVFIILGLSILIDFSLPVNIYSFLNKSNSFLLIMGFLLLGALAVYKGMKNFMAEILCAYLDENYEKTYGTVVDVMMRQNIINSSPRIVVIGGGTGLSCLLRGAKHLTHNITAVVTVADDGGSSGRIREMNIPAPGDIRNCIVSLASASDEMRDLFNYRYSEDDIVFENLSGHSFGNIFIATLAKITGSFQSAVRLACRVLDVKGEVLPVTLCDSIQLIARLEDGSMVIGESEIGKVPAPIEEIFMEPECFATEEVKKAIYSAEMIVIGPGSLFTSIIATLLPKGIKEALNNTDAKIVYVANIMTQNSESLNLSLSEHVEKIEQYIGRNTIDSILVNNEDIPKEIIDNYRLQGADKVENDFRILIEKGYDVILSDLLYKQDLLPVRHDSYKVGWELQKLLMDK